MESQAHWVNNFWGEDDAGYHRLMQRMHHAKQTSEEVKAFYNERHAIELEYSKRLFALSKRPLGSHETGGAKASLDAVRSTTQTMATTHETVARQLSEQLLAPFDAFALSMRDRRKTVEDTMGKLTKAKTSQNNAAEKARGRYRAECNRIAGFHAQQNLLMGRELERNNQKLEKSMYQVEGLQRQYQDLLKALAQSMEAWNAEWRVSCDRLERLEEERLAFMKSNLWAYANAVSASCVADDEGCESIRVSLEQCDPSRDLEHYASKHGTGSRIQDPPEFVNFLNGFSRDSEDDQGHYHVANFDSANLSSSQLDDMPELHAPTQTSMNASPRSAASSQFSPGSPGSQYSAGTSVGSSASPAIAAEFQAPPSKTVHKRRSWAMPFKRQSSPDVSLIKPNRFDMWDRPAEPQTPSQPQTQAPAQPKGLSQPHAVAHTQTQRPTSSSARGLSLAPVAQGAEAGKSYVSSAQSEDPLLAALERLKAPSSVKPRPKSTPGYEYMSAGASSPYGNGHTTQASPTKAAASPPKRRPVNRKQVSSEYEPAAPDTLPRGYELKPVQQSAQRQYPQQQFGQQHNNRVENVPPQAAHTQQYPQRYHHQHNAAQQLPPPQQRLPPTTSDGRPVLKHCRARYDYRAAIPEEVTFRKGDMLLITETQEDGWWDCEVYGRREFGLAPSNFLGEIA